MPLHHCRIAGDEDIVRHIMYDNAAGRYYDAVADGDSRADRHISSQPAVLTYGYRICRLLGFTTEHMVLGMLRGIQLAVRADKGMTSYPDMGAVKDGTSEIQEYAFGKMDSVPMVAIERRGDIGRSRHIRDKLLYYRTIVFIIRCHRLQACTQKLCMSKA